MYISRKGEHGWLLYNSSVMHILSFISISTRERILSFINTKLLTEIEHKTWYKIETIHSTSCRNSMRCSRVFQLYKITWATTIELPATAMSAVNKTTTIPWINCDNALSYYRIRFVQNKMGKYNDSTIQSHQHALTCIKIKLWHILVVLRNKCHKLISEGTKENL